MKITEQLLLDNYIGKSNGADNVSLINNETIWWVYRTGRRDDGYNPVCDRDNAGEITLEYSRVGTIDLGMDCNGHPNIEKIKTDEEKLWGVEV